MAVFLDLSWRLLLAGLFFTAFLLATMPWLRVELHAHLPAGTENEEMTLRGTLYTQSGYEAVSGRLTSPAAGGLFQLFQRIVINREDERRVDGCRLLALYGPLLLVGLLTALFMTAGPRRHRVVFGITLVAFVLLAVQLLLGFPLAAEVTRFLPELDGVRTQIGLQETPTLIVVSELSSTMLLLVPGLALLVAGLGFVLPKPNYTEEKPA